MPPAWRSRSSPNTFVRIRSMSCARCPSLSVSCSSPVSASTRYASRSSVFRRKSTFDNEQSPQKKPSRCSRTNSSTSASITRSSVSSRSLCANNDRYGSDCGSTRVIRAGSIGSPSDVSRPVTTATALTAGTPMRSRLRSSAYSRFANDSRVSLIATTAALERTNRPMCREMPRPSGTSRSGSHSASGMFHGSRISAGSGCVDVSRTLIVDRPRTLLVRRSCRRRPEHAVEVVVAEQPARVAPVAYGHEAVESPVPLAERVGVERVQLAPVRSSLGRPQDLLDAREVRPVVHTVVLVHGDVGVGAVVPGGQPDVIGRGEAHFDRKRHMLLVIVDPRLHLGEYVGETIARHRVLHLAEPYAPGRAEDPERVVGEPAFRQGPARHAVEARDDPAAAGGNPVQ